jgi:hypothetical protein
MAPAVEFGWSGRLLVFLLLAVAPFLALFQPQEREMLLPPRLALYASAVIGIGVLVIITGLVLIAEGVTPSAIGLRSTSLESFVAWTLATTVGALAGELLVTRVATRMGLRESRLTFHLMPQTRRELLAFMGVSLTAGFGEELTYHGFLLAGLVGWLGSGWLAAVAANLAFGLLHSYQGHVGAVRAFVMGYLLSLPVVTGAGLWPAIVGHVLVDALLGLGLWKLMLPPDGRAPEV